LKSLLTDIACKSAVCPPGKARARLTDAGGLYLEVSPSGSRRWFWKYYFASKEKRLALDTYPAVPLKQALSERDVARRTLQSGSDPSKLRQIKRLEAQLSEANTFEEVARELHATKASGWSKQYGERWLERMEKDLFPWIGPVPLPEITAPMLLNTLRKIEKRGARETAHTLRQTAGQVFRYGVATGHWPLRAQSRARPPRRSSTAEHQAHGRCPGAGTGRRTDAVHLRLFRPAGHTYCPSPVRPALPAPR